MIIINNIAIEKRAEVLRYLNNGLVNSPDTNAARCEQQEGLKVFRKTMLMLSERGMLENDFFKIYQNSFSRCRSRFDEYARVLVTSKWRK